MNIQEKINYFTENLTLEKAVNFSGQLMTLKDQIGRYIKKEDSFKSKMPLQFTSQDLRSLTTVLERLHKQANKKIQHISIYKRLVDRTGKIKQQLKLEEDENKKHRIKKKCYSDEVAYTTKFMALARDLQNLISCFNYFAVETLIHEEIAQTNKENDDKILRDELEFILFEIMSEN